MLFLINKNKNNNLNHDVTHLSTKLVVIKKYIGNDLESISKLASMMNIDQLYIFSIFPDPNLEYSIEEVESPSKISHISIGLDYFMETVLGGEQPENFWNLNKSSLYILKDGNYSDLKRIFTSVKGLKTTLVKGSSQKSHLVSPIEFRLSTYLMILSNMDFKKVTRQNAFQAIKKDRYLPSSEA
uniref:Uncharacterized protein n=1 Tax=Clonostachys rogersoniana TaxID=122658 RepID=A0A8F1Y2I1_CLORO|nr:hypothetical protein [Clonostachys rogersoniana]